MPWQENDHLARSVLELGEPEALYRVQPRRFFAKLGLGLALLALGALGNYWWWVHGPATFGHLELLILVVLPLMGATLLWHMYRHRGLHVLFYPTGMLRLIRGEVDSFPWTDILMVHFKVQKAAEPQFSRRADGTLVACWLPVEIPIFKIWDSGLTVTRSDGVSVHLGPVLSDYDRLAKDLQRRTFATLWPAVLEHFRAGMPLLFDDVELSSAGITTEKKFLTWRQVGDVVISQGKLSIKQKGKWLPWRVKDLGMMPNPHVLLALITEGKREHADAMEVITENNADEDADLV